jgi:peptidoglycan/LPS O-acetylase OafA/YrhL
MFFLCFYLMVLAARTWPELSFADPVLAAADAYVSRLLLLTTGVYFLVGANLYLLGRDGWSAAGAAAFAASLAAGAVGLWLSAENSAAVHLHARSPSTPVLIWLVFVAGLALSLLHHRIGRGSARMQRVARSAGLASYPLYLFHNIGGAFLFGLLIATGVGTYPALLLAIALCIAVSVGFATWVEPTLRRGLARRLARGTDDQRKPAGPDHPPGDAGAAYSPAAVAGALAAARLRLKRAPNRDAASPTYVSRP